jgi:hypothetical protein
VTEIRVKTAALALIILCFFAQSGLGQEAEAHWLIGRWEGNLSGYIGRSSPRRTLRVTEVAPDGEAKGMWYVTGQRLIAAFIQVEGAHVKIATAGNSLVELTREGDDLLVGKYIPQDGETLPVKMIKVEGGAEAGDR